MADTFRALCAELTAWAEKTSAHYFQPPDVLLRARAALSVEPAVPEGREPATPPADGEVAELVAALQSMATDADRRCRFSNAERLSRAAELLERQALVPVPVSERPPGPEDCAPWPQPSDNSGWCWMSRTVHGFYGSFAIWEQVSVVPTCREVYAHWLPAHALPVPEAGE